MGGLWLVLLLLQWLRKARLLNLSPFHVDPHSSTCRTIWGWFLQAPFRLPSGCHPSACAPGGPAAASAPPPGAGPGPPSAGRSEPPAGPLARRTRQRRSERRARATSARRTRRGRVGAEDCVKPGTRGGGGGGFREPREQKSPWNLAQTELKRNGG